MKKLLAASAVASALALGLGITGSASAAGTFSSCTGSDPAYDITGKVTPSYDCTILDPLDGEANDVPQPGFVNEQEFFNFSDWLFDGKTDESPGPSLVSFAGDDQSGTFDFTGDFSDVATLMFVFKDGGDTNLVGYLITLTDLTATGTYSSPFVSPPFDASGSGARDISHISVYYRSNGGGGQNSNGGGGQNSNGGGVPEPATLALVGLGLLGAVAARRQRKAI